MSWINPKGWTKKPNVTVWASDGEAIYEARWIAHDEAEVLDGAEEGHFSPPTGEDWLKVGYIWTGEGKPKALPK